METVIRTAAESAIARLRIPRITHLRLSGTDGRLGAYANGVVPSGCVRLNERVGRLAIVERSVDCPECLDG